ncbi:MAG: peptide-methionine (S)-S-oxide reductase, partial [Flavobacteriaceae bacterium]
MRLLIISLQIAACTIAAPKPTNNPTPVAKATYTMPQEYKAAYFASGCFWCVEAVFENVKGVEEAISGYAGGATVNPNYRQVITGKTGHAESIKVVYDPK